MNPVKTYRFEQPKQDVYISFDDGGLGDGIARLPIIPYILEEHPHLNVTLWVPSYLQSIAERSIFNGKTLKKTKRLLIRSFSDAVLANPTTPGKGFARVPYTNLCDHMTDHAFRVICNRTDIPSNYKNYLPIDLKHINTDRFNLPEKYVVLPTGFTAEVREFRPEVVNALSDYLVKKGYTPVFLGKKETPSGTAHTIIGNFKEEIDYTKGINLIDQTTMLESVGIIKNAAAIVGLDNGLLHLAATTEIPIVGGFTTVRPEHRLPYRHDVLGWNYYPVFLTPEELPCTFCQSNWNFTFRHKFTECYYHDYKCTKLLVADKYIEQLEKIL